MTHFVKTANCFRIFGNGALDICESLPVGTYTIKFDKSHEQFYIEIINDFTYTGKLYGDTVKNTDRIFNTFLTKNGSLGAMFCGDKGSGKSLLAKTLAMKGYENNIPTIVINEPHHGETFNQVIQSINQEAIIIFDEFEKVYKKEHQEAILSLLDGTYPTKKLFIFTCNDIARVDSHMKNRPGRIYYMVEFNTLAPEFIDEYCHDNLKNLEHIEKLKKMPSICGKFNFDMLQAMVYEMNLYNETPDEVMKLLNVKPTSTNIKYIVSLYIDGKQIEPEYKIWEGNPLIDKINIGYYDEKDRWVEADMRFDNFKKLDNITESYTFEKDNTTVVLTRDKTSIPNYFQLL